MDDFFDATVSDFGNYEKVEHKVTIRTVLAAFPGFLWFYVVPGPIKFVCFYFLEAWILPVVDHIRKHLVVAGLHLDGYLMRKQGQTPLISTKLALQRLHGKVGIIENFKYRRALYKGEKYLPKAYEEWERWFLPSERYADKYEPRTVPAWIDSY